MADTFDPDKYLAEKLGTSEPKEDSKSFDPDEYLKSKGVSPEQDIQNTVRQGGMPAALLREGANGVMANAYAPVTGAVATAGDLPDILQGKKSLGDAYRGNRDYYQHLLDETKKQYPITSTAADIGGAVASPMNKLLQYGMPGAIALGGAYGLGGSKADLTQGNVGGAAKDAAIGGATGGITYGVAQALAPKLQQMFRSGAEDAATMHLRPTPGITRALGKEGVKDVAREALDSGAIGYGNKAADTAGNLEDLSNEVGAAKSDMVNASQTPVNPMQIANRFQNEVIDPLSQTSENQGLANQMLAKKQAFIKKYLPEGNSYGPNDTITPDQAMTPAQVEAEKMAVNNGINYKIDAPVSMDANKGWARILKESAEDAIDNPDFQTTKNAYGNLEQGQQMAERTAALQGGGLMSHITDVGMGGAALTGNPLAAGGLAARLTTKGRVSSTVAAGLNDLSKVAPSTMAGAATSAVSAAKSNPNSANLGQRVYNMSDQQTAGVIPILKQAGLGNSADLLEKGLANNGEKKTSAIFSLMQNPATRDILNAHTKGIEESND
jgi:hypothetical protein